jgi:phosphatidate cytidylyltransferase
MASAASLGSKGAAAAASAAAAAATRLAPPRRGSGAGAAAAAGDGPPSLTLLSSAWASPAPSGARFAQGRRRRGGADAWSSSSGAGAAADDDAARRHRRPFLAAAAAAASTGAGAVWPAATPANEGGPAPSCFDPDAAAAAAAAAASRAEVAANAAAAALEAAAHEAEQPPGSAPPPPPPPSSSYASAASTGGSLDLPAADGADGAAAGASTTPKKPNAAWGGLAKRVASGVLLGAGGAAVVAAGGAPFLCAALFVTYHATREFYGLLTSRGLSRGMTPPGPVVSACTTLLCMSIALLTHATRGRSGVAMAVAGFVLLSLNLLASPKPKFAQLTSSLFGLFYCGYLPSFWIKLRAVAAPLPADVPLAALLPAAAGGGATVGLAVTLTAVACVIAADTGAYFVGKSLGRTKLTDISPKKTVEGALGGLLSSVAVALGAQALLTGWPAVPAAAAPPPPLPLPPPWAAAATAPLLAAAFGAAVFLSSLLGDLIESIIKREAGLKDSGDLIPGHGGLLDRFDSYIFTGAVAYGFVVFGHLH